MLASLLLSACGVIIGIKPLEGTDDGGVVVVPRDAEASAPVVDAPSGDEDGPREIAPPVALPRGRTSTR